MMALLAGCNCGSPQSSADAARPDAGEDSQTDLRTDRGAHDQRSPDAGPIDAAFTDYPPGACGGSRTMSPVLVPKGKAMDCGPACKQLTWGASPGRLYAVSGDLLTYVNTLGTPGGNRIYYVDLKADKEYQLHGDWPNLGEGCSIVATDGQQIATSCVRAGLTDPRWQAQWLRSLTLYDPATHIARDLLCLERKLSAKSCFPDLIALNNSGITIHLALGACPFSSVYHLPFGGSQLQDLAGQKGGVGHVRGAGDIVVWMQSAPGWGAYQIVAYNLKTHQAKRISPTTKNQWMPQVSGDKIVWVDGRNEPKNSDWMQPRNSDIYVYDLKTGKTDPVLLHPATQEEPDVWGDWVVWQDYRANPNLFQGSEVDIYAKNLKTGTIYQITDRPEMELYARVDHDRIFYQAIDRVNKWRPILMVDLPAWLKAKAKSKAQPKPTP
ncbi:MAG: hypothetical protein KAI47_01050 [Deltaproteobacteria bacterium]|nr:hypothetical protein [Deltaproteobacteria bacterium]